MVIKSKPKHNLANKFLQESTSYSYSEPMTALSSTENQGIIISLYTNLHFSRQFYIWAVPL